MIDNAVTFAVPQASHIISATQSILYKNTKYTPESLQALEGYRHT